MPTRGTLCNPQPYLVNFSSCMYDIAGANAAHPLSPGFEFHTGNATEAADTGIGESQAESYMKFHVDVCS